MLDQTNIRTDFDAIPDGATIILHPREANPLHRAPVEATHSIGFFYCNGSEDLPGDVSDTRPKPEISAGLEKKPVSSSRASRF